MIYRLPCGKALSVRKSLRAVRTVGQNRYIENTPLGSPSGTARGWKRLFFWLQKSGVNNKSGNAVTGRRYNPSVTALKSLIAVPAPLTQGSRGSLSIAAVRPYTGEARNALQPRGAKRRKLRPSAAGGPHPSFFCRQAAKEIHLPRWGRLARRWQGAQRRQPPSPKKAAGAFFD